MQGGTHPDCPEHPHPSHDPLVSQVVKGYFLCARDGGYLRRVQPRLFWAGARMCGAYVDAVGTRQRPLEGTPRALDDFDVEAIKPRGRAARARRVAPEARKRSGSRIRNN